MKDEVTISDCTSSDDKDDTNFLAFIASSIIVDHLTTSSNVQEVTTKTNDDD